MPTFALVDADPHGIVLTGLLLLNTITSVHGIFLTELLLFTTMTSVCN